MQGKHTQNVHGSDWNSKHDQHSHDPMTVLHGKQTGSPTDHYYCIPPEQQTRKSASADFSNVGVYNNPLNPNHTHSMGLKLERRGHSDCPTNRKHSIKSGVVTAQGFKEI